MRNGKAPIPRKRRQLLKALAETPVVRHRSATLGPASPSKPSTLGAILRREPVYAPPRELLGRLVREDSERCRAPRRRVLVATEVRHPPQGTIAPILGDRPLRPPRSAANLWHQVLEALWSLDDEAVAEVAEGAALPNAESGCEEARPAHSGVPLRSQVPPGEELTDVREPPQAEAPRTRRRCEPRCGPVSPAASFLAAKAGRTQPLDPECRNAHKIEDSYVPFPKGETPSQRGKPGESCPCECVCVPIITTVPFEPDRWRFLLDLGRVVIESIAPGLGILARAGKGILDVLFPDAVVGFGSDGEGAPVATHHGWSPAVDALRGGQSQGLGVGLDLDSGVMRPDLTLTALSMSGIAGPIALAPPEHAGAGGSFVLALQGDGRNGFERPAPDRVALPNA